MFKRIRASFFGAGLLCAAAGGTAHAASRALGDLTLGSADSFSLNYNASFPSAYLDGNTYFAIGCHLWKTNGLPGAGTGVVTTDSPAGTCTIRGVLALNGGIVFVRGNELWSSDGTTGGTAKLSVAGFVANSLTSLALWEGKPGLAYLLISGSGGNEVWATNGTAAGTVKLVATASNTISVAFMPDHAMAILANGLWKAIDNSGAATSIASGFTAATTVTPALAGNRLLFVAADATHGNEPWGSNLTAGGTQMLVDITAGTGGTTVNFGPEKFGRRFFQGYDYLWSSDGLDVDTAQLTDVGMIVQKEMAAIGNQVVFPAKMNDAKYYFWRSADSPASAVQVAAAPIRDSTTDPVVFFAQRSNDALYCTFGPSPYRLFRVNVLPDTVTELSAAACSALLANERRDLADSNLIATVSGLSVLRDIKPRASLLPYPPSGFSVTHPGLAGGSMFYFTQSTVTTGREPWSMDLTDADAPVCSYPGKSVPDNNIGGRTDVLYFPQAMKAGPLRVYLTLAHTYIGDLGATLTHVESGKTVQLFNRPGVPTLGTFGCSSNDLDIVLSDTASGHVGDGCNTTSSNQAYPRGTTFQPNQALSTFAGDDLTGTWRLTVTDVVNGSAGGIERWCLQNTDRIYFDDYDGP